MPLEGESQSSRETHFTSTLSIRCNQNGGYGVSGGFKNHLGLNIGRTLLLVLDIWMKRKSERVSHVSDSDGGYVGVPFTERGIAARRAWFGGKIVFSPFVEFGVTMGCPNGHVQWTFKFEAWEGIWVREILEHDPGIEFTWVDEVGQGEHFLENPTVCPVQAVLLF